MTLTLIVTLVLAGFVGLSLGTLGGGGSILTVPLLTYVAGMPAREAIAASLFVVGITSLSSLTIHARHQRVRWRTGIIFGAAGMVGAFGGGLIGGRLPGTVLLVAFALMMIATATAMILKKSRTSDAHDDDNRATEPVRQQDATRTIPVVRTIIDGVFVGFVTGIVGAGGGFLIVPALVLLGGLSMPVAVGTSLLVIAMKSFAGLAGYLTSVSLDWPLVLSVTAIAVAGALIGSKLSGRVPAQTLQKVFGIFVLVTGGLILASELPLAGAIGVGVVAVLALASFTVCRFTSIDCRVPRRSIN